MKIQLTAAQKRGLMVVVGAIILVGGWRFRAGHTSAAQDTTCAAASAPAAKVRVELNAADTTALQEVKGIGAASARRIVRYRGLIGGFTSTDQLLKVWGITPENFLRIEEQVYVDTTTAAYAALRQARPRFDDRPRRGAYPQRPRSGYAPASPAAVAAAASQPEGMPTPQAQASPAPTRAAHRAPIDLNTADSLELVSIAGIGPSTARNIIKYRSLIYFYESVEQLSEVWGVRPENLERMKPHLSIGESRRNMPHLRINEMTVEEMGRHRYLGFKEARIVVAYREMHGPIRNFEALQQIREVAPEKWEKLRPYLVF